MTGPQRFIPDDRVRVTYGPRTGTLGTIDKPCDRPHAWWVTCDDGRRRIYSADELESADLEVFDDEARPPRS